MKSIPASEFSSKCLQLIEEVIETGMPVVITQNGQPVAQLGPALSKPVSLIGAHCGKITIVGDILDPVDEQWEAER